VRFVPVAGGTSLQVDTDGAAGGAVFRALLTLRGIGPGQMNGTRDLLVR